MQILDNLINIKDECTITYWNNAIIIYDTLSNLVTPTEGNVKNTQLCLVTVLIFILYCFINLIAL